MESGKSGLCRASGTRSFLVCAPTVPLRFTVG